MTTWPLTPDGDRQLRQLAEAAIEKQVHPANWSHHIRMVLMAGPARDFMEMASPTLILAMLSARQHGTPDTSGLLDRIRRETREAVEEGDRQDCSSPDCIADAVYEIVRSALAATATERPLDVGLRCDFDCDACRATVEHGLEIAARLATPEDQRSLVDVGSELGRLLAERDRLIAAGADPAELLVPLAPDATEATP